MHMSRGRRTVWAATLAVTVITAWAVLRSADTDDGESEDRSTGSERRLTERTANTADRFAFAGPVQEPDEDSLSERWNEMTSSKRVDVLTARFHTAIDDLRSGLDVEQNLETAEGALTALRSELYPTERGRERHEAMEAELDRVRSQDHLEDEP
jgi:hypothetical protein